MHEITARALTLAHETLRCGVPHFRERRLIPIRTSAHLIVFDAAKISPLYTMLKVEPTDETLVDREDNFSSGDISLPDELSTTEKHYGAVRSAQVAATELYERRGADTESCTIVGGLMGGQIASPNLTPKEIEKLKCLLNSL